MPAHSDDEIPPVISRSKRDLTALFGVFLFIGVAIVGGVTYATIASPPRNDTPIWAVVTVSSAFLVLPNLVGLWIVNRLRVVANARGLQIRSAFKTQFIAWRDMEDYELRASPNSAATARLSWIRTRGKWQRLPQFLTKMESLRACIQAEAQWSRAQSWQLNVERDEADNWPKTYAYRDPNGTKMFAVVAVGLLLIVTIIFVIPDSAAHSRGDALDKWLHIGAMLLPLLGMHFALFRARKKQNSQTIRADQSGLTLVDDQNPTRIGWEEIGDYGIEDAKKGVALSQYVVEGAGARLTFHREITDFAELKALICARAIHAQSSEWKHRENADLDTIGGAQSLWSGGVAGVGRKKYHYRTRTLRAVLTLGVIISLGLSAGLLFSLLWKKPPLVEILTLGFMCGIFLFFTIGGVLAFWRASIQTDETGVTQINFRGQRFLRWSEIESFNYNGHFYEIKGQNVTIRFWLVAANESLQTEIEAQTGLKLRRVGQSDDDE